MSELEVSECNVVKIKKLFHSLAEQSTSGLKFELEHYNIFHICFIETNFLKTALTIRLNSVFFM